MVLDQAIKALQKIAEQYPQVECYFTQESFADGTFVAFKFILPSPIEVEGAQTTSSSA